jgi:hypothetical protein
MDDRTVLSSGVIGGDTNWAPVAGSSVMNNNETGGAVTASAALLGQSIT